MPFVGGESREVVTRKASAALNGYARAVVVSGKDTVSNPSSVGDPKLLGVVSKEDTLGTGPNDVVGVGVFGAFDVLMSGTGNAGDWVVPAADGKGLSIAHSSVPTGTRIAALGIALEGWSDGDTIKVFVRPCVLKN